MKEFIFTHKKILLITIAALMIVGIVAALICTAIVKSNIPKGRIFDSGVFGDVTIYDSTQGEIIIDGSVLSQSGTTGSEAMLISNPDDIWQENAYAGNHTMIEAVQMEDGSIGVLTIQKMGLSVNVYEGPDQMEDMNKGVAHFPQTSAWDGNIGLSAHNINFDGSAGYFLNLHTLSNGDLIQYQSALGERDYVVQSIQEIDATDWSPLGYSDENRLTLITCISQKPSKRLCVQALEQKKS